MLQFLLEHGHFWNIDISQGSVVTSLRCGGILKYDFVANLPLSLPVKEFQKSVNIWGGYVQEFSVLFFFDSQCIYLLHMSQLEINQIRYVRTFNAIQT